MDSSLLLVSTWDLEVLTQDQLVEILRKEVRLSNPNLSLLNNLFAAGIPVNYVSLDHIVIDAAIYSTRKCLKILIDCGMNVDSASYCGETPIIAATKHNRYAIVKQLVEMGANIGARDTQGRTSLHHAVLGKGRRLRDLLIANGANIDAQDDRGWTPLHHAASQNLMQTVRWLIERGADRSIATNDGHLPVNLVRRNPYTGSRRGHIPRRIDARVEEMKSILQLDQHGERVAA